MGVIAAATMVIPGVSGSMMLMLLGYYNPVVGSVSGLVDALLSANVGTALTCCGVLIPFGIGVIVGIFAVAKLIEVLLRRFPGPTYCAIMGLVTASPVAILMGLSYAGITAMTIVISVDKPNSVCYNCNVKKINSALLRAVEGIGPMKPGNRLNPVPNPTAFSRQMRCGE